MNNILQIQFQIIYGSLSMMIVTQLIKIVLLLVAVAYFTIAERKVMASIQRRKGPNVVGI
jgi:NADH-quinone oxidoreductase subunit H